MIIQVDVVGGGQSSHAHATVSRRSPAHQHGPSPAGKLIGCQIPSISSSSDQVQDSWQAPTAIETHLARASSGIRPSGFAWPLDQRASYRGSSGHPLSR